MTTTPPVTTSGTVTAAGRPALRRWPLNPLRWVEAIQDAIWEASDDEAYDLGWDVVELHGGWSRQYRDPHLAEFLAARRVASAGLHGGSDRAGSPGGRGLR